ncbi:MAG: FHA domain-containing protein [Desulfobacterales bacterium]|nr:FHA domain-containing protein [Desulfobacterales bacterium]MDX2509281.1 FHA domain-containing protein [Desulfobacterales bacterium]
MLTILLKFNEKILKTIEFDKNEIIIGRNAANDIAIENLAVSKQHARIVKQDEEYYIEDLNSTNGTYLNKIRITKKNLNNNDIIIIGKHSLEIHFVKKGDVNKIQHIKNDTMKLTTEKHIKMLAKQKE